MVKYEVMYIMDPALEEEPRKELVEKFSSLVTQNGGTVDKIDDWGKRRLAYEINDKNEGFYILMHFTADPSFPRELERNFLIQESIIRFLVTKLDEE